MLRHVPNFLSGLRLLAAPLAGWAILSDRDALAFMVFAAAGFSDLADGFVARRWGSTSRFGAWLDPLADKLLMLICILALWGVDAVPLWLAGLVIFRDVAIMSGALLAKLCGLPLRIQPLGIGKATTAVLAVLVGARLLLLALNIDAPHSVLAGSYTAAGFILLSGGAYALIFLRRLVDGRRTA